MEITMLQPNDASFGLYRSALKSMADMTNVYLAGMERLQSAQAEVLRDLVAEQAEVAKKMESISSLEELQTVQAGFTRNQMEHLGSFWRGMVTNSCQSQMNFLKEAQTKAREVTESLQNIEGAPTSPAMSAMKMFVDAAHSAYAAGLRVTEEAAALTATQMEAGRNAATTAIAQVNGKGRRAAA
jgi:phasin family protein